MRSLLASAACATTLFFVPSHASAQQATPAQAIAMQQYARTTPYIDLPIPQLTKTVPELSGLKAQSNSDQLDTLLQKTGDSISAQLPRVPNLLCREEIAEETEPHVDAPTTVRLSGSPGASTMQSPVPSNQWGTGDWHPFEYIIRTSKEEDGSITLEETREGTSSKTAAAGPKGTGFASLWMIFAPGNRSESTFRYLGTQKVDGRSTQVVAFAQIPGKVRKPALIDTGAGTVPLLYQGFAWIDDDFHILRLRTDLRAPLPELNLKRITSTIDFSQVIIQQFPETLWLPKKVEVLWQTNDVQAGELHRYSKYQLFHASVKILP